MRLRFAMDKDIFRQNLIKATDEILPFSQEHVTNPLPLNCHYLIFPNQSYDKNPLQGDEQIFPDEKLSNGKYLGSFDAEQVIEYLWRNGKIPEWVNMTVYSYDLQYTYLELLCCGRFTAMEEHLYHRWEGYPPFHILSPSLPPNWENLEQSGKFDLYWHGRKPENVW